MGNFLIIFLIALFNINICDNCSKIEEVLNNKKVLNFLHTELESRRILFLEQNKYCNLNKKINSFLEIKSTSKKEKNIIKIIKFSKKNSDNLEIILFYPVENVEIQAFFKNKKLIINTVEH